MAFGFAVVEVVFLSLVLRKKRGILERRCVAFGFAVAEVFFESGILRRKTHARLL